VGVPVSMAGGAKSTAEGTVSVWVTTVVPPPPLPPLRSWRVGDADVVGAADELDVDTGEVAVPDVSFTAAIAIPATTTTASAPPLRALEHGDTTVSAAAESAGGPRCRGHHKRLTCDSARHASARSGSRRSPAALVVARPHTVTSQAVSPPQTNAGLSELAAFRRRAGPTPQVGERKSPPFPGVSRTFASARAGKISSCSPAVRVVALCSR
jgi:hypothetical protein